MRLKARILDASRRCDPVDRYLDLWSTWMRKPATDLGYPTRSSFLATGGTSGADAFDHLCDDADHYAAKATDAVICGLSPIEQSAVHHVHLAAVFRCIRESITEVYERARGKVARELAKKGLPH